MKPYQGGGFIVQGTNPLLGNLILRYFANFRDHHRLVPRYQPETRPVAKNGYPPHPIFGTQVPGKFTKQKKGRGTHPDQSRTIMRVTSGYSHSWQMVTFPPVSK